MKQTEGATPFILKHSSRRTIISVFFLIFSSGYSYGNFFQLKNFTHVTSKDSSQKHCSSFIGLRVTAPLLFNVMAEGMVFHRNKSVGLYLTSAVPFGLMMIVY